MPSLYQLVSCSRGHTTQILRFLKPQLYEPSVQWCSYPLHNFHTQHTTVCELFPYFLSPPLRIQLQVLVFNVCQTQTPFSQTTTAALSVVRPCTTHIAQLSSQFSHCHLYSGIKKMLGIIFWATFVYVCICVCVYIYIQDVTGGMCQTSGGCSLC